MTAIDQIIHSPRMPDYIRELRSILSAERDRRQKFVNEVREDQKAEFINGEVIVHSPVRLEHNDDDASMNLAMLIKAYVQKHSLGQAGHEKLMISLTRNDYEPDICYFGVAKAAKLRPRQMRFPAPDMIVEVVSRSTERTDRTIKFEDYAAHCVAEYWIVDPRKCAIEQYLLAGDQYELAHKLRSGTVCSPVIKGFEIPVKAVFDAQANLKALAAIVQSNG